MIANLNNIRWQQGKPPLGYLNPWLYSLPRGKGLTDIINGASVGCYQTDNAVVIDAVEGWDAVTGLGTPVFPDLVELMP